MYRHKPGDQKMIEFFKSTIGRKQLVAIAGLGLAVFVFTHMAGNMLILFSPKAYNLYGHALVTNPLIYFAEAGLVGIFFLHVLLALVLTIKNMCSRTQKYAKSPAVKAKASLFSRTMWFQGLVILAFIILHLITFKYGTNYTVEYDGETIRDLHRLVVEIFTQPVFVIGYIITLVLMFAHLAHGLSSVFQSLGVSRDKYGKLLDCIGFIYSAVVVGGFLSQPLYVYFIYSN
jgi:succinate dehydrogenase / fumarate reductase, cytochrome b subunit